MLPYAQALSPITFKPRFATLAGECDLMLCGDPRDPFERRATIARVGANRWSLAVGQLGTQATPPLNTLPLLPIKGMMSLDATLARSLDSDG
jgi:hypothetical protein